MNINEFITELEKLDIILTEIQLKQLETYYELLVEWNEKINLTAITEKNQVYLKHFYDSLTIIKALDLNEENTLCDVGTGAGFPGLVLKIVYPHIQVTLVDSLNKRVNFLNEVINTTNLEGIKAVHARAEEFALNHRSEFDITTARAVSKLNVLLEFCIPLTKVGKYFIALKANIEDEIEQANKALKVLNSEVEKIIEFNLPYEDSHRTIIKIRKNKENNPIYPRNYRDITKRPL